MQTEKIKIKYFDKEIEKLKYIDGKSDWIDLRAAENMVIEVGDFTIIPLGIAMELPTGYEAHVVPRSSTFKNYGLIQTNSMGIIDESYCGDYDMWRMPVYCLRGNTFKDGRMVTIINKGDRVCQFRIVKHQPTIQLEETDKLDGTNRGGFGSTGTK